MSASNPSKSLVNSIQPLLLKESETGSMSRLDHIKARMDKMKGIALRLSMRMPPTSQRKIARLLGFNHVKFPDLDPHVQMLLSVRKWLSAATKTDSTYESSRIHFRRDMAAIANPTKVASVKDWKIPSRSGQLSVRHYTPIRTESAEKHHQRLPLLVYFHGGSFIVGDVDTHDDPCRLLCQFGQMQVLSVSYRCMPDHPSPAAIEDCVDTLKWAYEHIQSLGADPNKITVGGDSAGGNLAAVVSQLAVGTTFAPAAQLMIYPILDLVNDYPSHEAFGHGLFLSRVDLEAAKNLHLSCSQLPFSDPRVSPIRGNLSGLPPALLVTAAFDSLRDEGETYAIKMREAGSHCIGYRVEGQGHGFVSMATINRAAFKATKRIAKDFRVLLDSK
ncbi:MAG: alpha/beta hydrolase [Candidatus Saccharibacteria bacterium]|nr:alpha/beta hydrolase [Moraxellaceae bacterium]